MENKQVIEKWLEEKAKEKTVRYHLTKQQILDLLSLLCTAIEIGKNLEVQQDRLELTQYELLELFEEFDELAE